MMVLTSYELESFCSSIFIGILCGVIYDFVKSLGFKNHIFEDICLWLFMILGAGSAWIELLNGAVRWYIIAGAVLTFIIYYSTIEKTVFLIFSFFVRKIYCFFNIILKILLTAGGFLGKIIGKYRAKSINNKEVTVNEKA